MHILSLVPATEFKINVQKGNGKAMERSKNNCLQSTISKENWQLFALINNWGVAHKSRICAHNIF